MQKLYIEALTWNDWKSQVSPYLIAFWHPLFGFHSHVRPRNKLKSRRHHLNQCTAETKEIPEVEDGECCIFVLIENKIKSVEFDVWARSDSIQVVQSLSKAGGAENEACRSETFEVWREIGKCVALFLSKIFWWEKEIARYDILISCLVQRWFSIVQHCKFSKQDRWRSSLCVDLFWEIYNLTRTVSNNSVLRHA